MRIIFAGTPDFAVPALNELISAGHDITLVLTQPDRPAGRGMKLNSSPVKMLAKKNGLDIFQPETLQSKDAQARIKAVRSDIMIVAAYGLIIPSVVLGIPKHGCLNIHASLLPRWRGAAPIQRAMLANDSVTGVTIMQVSPKLDAGAMLKKAVIPITEKDTAQTLHDSLATLGGNLMLQVLAELDVLEAEPQDEAWVTYAEKLQKSEAPLDWNKDADQLARQVRAFNPFPVARANMRGESWRIWFARALDGQGNPGQIVSVQHGISVACGQGVLCLETLQRPGGKKLGWKDFLSGVTLKCGDHFDV